MDSSIKLSVLASQQLLKTCWKFFSNRFQPAVLNGQSPLWTPVYAGVPRGSILGLLFFLIYINDLSKNISSEVKLFADDTSIFSAFNDFNVSAMQLNNDLLKINGHVNGKCLSILMLPNKHNRLFSLAKATNLLILLFFSIMFQLKDVTFRNI